MIHNNRTLFENRKEIRKIARLMYENNSPNLRLISTNWHTLEDSLFGTYNLHLLLGCRNSLPTSVTTINTIMNSMKNL